MTRPPSPGCTPYQPPPGPALRPALSRYRLGSELRRLRWAASLPAREAAGAAAVGRSTLSKIENGVSPVIARVLQALLDLYGVTDPGSRKYLADLAYEGRRRDWTDNYDDVLPEAARTFLALESAASCVRTFAADAMPGLAQTGDYAAELSHAAGLPVRLAEVTILRQQQARANPGQTRHIIINQSALRRQCPVDVMTRQLDHLAAIAASPAVTIQVTRRSEPDPILMSSFSVLSFGEADAPDVSYYGDFCTAITFDRRRPRGDALAPAFAAIAGRALPPAHSAELIRRAAKQSADGR